MQTEVPPDGQRQSRASDQSVVFRGAKSDETGEDDQNPAPLGFEPHEHEDARNQEAEGDDHRGGEALSYDAADHHGRVRNPACVS
jgi:hypothetical protein